MKSPKKIVLEELSRFLQDVPDSMVKDVPPEIEGDFAFPCFAHAKKAKKDPKVFAEELAKRITGGFVEKAEAKDGFVNFFLKPGKIADILIDEIEHSKADYGKGMNKGKILVEHTSANPNAPLHVGHLRNSVLGDSMARILQFSGYDAQPQFFVNDMGGQLALLALELSKIDYASDVKKSGKKPDAWLGEVYVRANKDPDVDSAKALQKKYEGGDKAVKKYFDFMVETALTGFKGTFKSYGISMNDFVRESDFVLGGKVEDVLAKFKKMPEWFEKEGMFALNVEKYGIKKELVLLRSDGTTLYTTRDIAYHLWKLQRGDCINVIANEQTLQQQHLRAGLDLLGVKDVQKRVRHMSYELVTVPGMRMSSRTGEFISADDLLDEGIKRAKSEIDSRKLDIPEQEKDRIAKAIAVGAIRFNMVRITPLKPIEFKWEEALNFEGESAPYLQYSHARACRILEKAVKLGKLSKPDYTKVQMAVEEQKLVLMLSKFPEIIAASAADLKPNLVANYLFSLAEVFNRFYFKCPVIDSEAAVQSYRLGMVNAFKQVMANGLALLSIEALERM